MHGKSTTFLSRSKATKPLRREGLLILCAFVSLWQNIMEKKLHYPFSQCLRNRFFAAVDVEFGVNIF